MSNNAKEQKYVQAINYFARKSNGNSINRLKLIKLLWLADRLHLLRYGRLTVDATYCAMPHGPVASEVYNVAKHPVMPYAKQYLEAQGLNVKSQKATDLSFFTKSELSAYDEIWANYGEMDRWDLRNMSHLYPEWVRHSYVEARKTSVPMNMEDFFEVPQDKEKSKFTMFEMDERKREYIKQKYERGQAMIKAMHEVHESCSGQSKPSRVAVTPSH